MKLSVSLIRTGYRYIGDTDTFGIPIDNQREGQNHRNSILLDLDKSIHRHLLDKFDQIPGAKYHQSFCLLLIDEKVLRVNYSKPPVFELSLPSSVRCAGLYERLTGNCYIFSRALCISDEIADNLLSAEPSDEAHKLYFYTGECGQSTETTPTSAIASTTVAEEDEEGWKIIGNLSAEDQNKELSLWKGNHHPEKPDHFEILENA
uniref:Uncharacterized protein n=1 Tax=Romanomermis culicivorax TaxID=13658 RepID=A0A915K8T0_ROMCU